MDADVCYLQLGLNSMRVSYSFGIKIPVSRARETTRDRNDSSSLEFTKKGTNSKVGFNFFERAISYSGNCIVWVDYPKSCSWRSANRSHDKVI